MKVYISIDSYILNKLFEIFFMDIKSKRDISRKLRVLGHAENSENISKTCRYFDISRETFYTWRLRS